MPYVPLTSPYLGIREVAELLGVSRDTVDEWTKRGRLPQPVRLGGPQGHRKWSREAIEAILNNRKS